MDFDLLNAVSYLEKPDGVIAAPLKSRYVLACRVEHNEALGKIYRLSCTQSDWQPVLLGYDINALEPFMSNPPASATRLMQQYWPGGLIIRMSNGVCLRDEWFNPALLGLMQSDDALMRDILSLQSGGVLLAVDACRYDDPPARSAASLYNSFGDDVDFVLERDEAVWGSVPETVISIERDGALRILRSGEVVLD
jgi:tRNA A37 threonylcarbamoyladenosine synthetase subunit TsaC/SUA5/YrdC